MYSQNEINIIRKRAKVLITNEINPEAGLDRDVILDFMTNADREIQGILLDNCPNLTLFYERAEYSLVANQSNYALPDHVFMDGDIVIVEYSYSGYVDDYVTITPIDISNFENGTGYRLSGYQLIGNELWVSPTPQTATGKIRITYNKQTEKLDARRGTIASAASDGTYYTSITVADDSVLDETVFAN